MVVLALAALALVPAGAAGSAAEERGPGSVRLEGRGFGHGKGLSQYGAKEAAEDGRTYRQILGFYYPGTRWGRAGGRMRVLITADTTSDVDVRARSGLAVRSVGSGRSWPLDRGGAQRWRIVAADGGTVSRVEYLTNRWHTERDVRGEAELSAGGRPIALVTPSGVTRYRGVLRSAVPASGSGRDTVNLVPLEDYLRGVVPQEVPALWHPQAVRAQAVAARTYAAFERGSEGLICDTSHCQVYGGASAEHEASDRAIRATRREVLEHRGEPAFTQFSASNGGWSVQGGFRYLPAQQDPWDSYPRWDDEVRATEIEAAFPTIGDFQQLRVRERDGNGAWGGRVLRLRLVGSSGRVGLTGEEFRSRFGLRSSWFRVP